MSDDKEIATTMSRVSTHNIMFRSYGDTSEIAEVYELPSTCRNVPTSSSGVDRRSDDAVKEEAIEFLSAGGGPMVGTPTGAKDVLAGRSLRTAGCISCKTPELSR